MTSQSKMNKKTTQSKNIDALNYEDIWKIIEVFLTRDDGRELIKHQLESYDLFLEKYIKEIILKVTKSLQD